MRKRYRYDAVTKSVIPLDKWLRKNREPKGHYIIPDIKPYKAVTGDMQGKWITSRKQHREFLKRNDLIEVGNEKSYFTKYGGMTPDNPNLVSDTKREEEICRTLKETMHQLQSK